MQVCAVSYRAIFSQNGAAVLERHLLVRLAAVKSGNGVVNGLEFSNEVELLRLLRFISTQPFHFPLEVTFKCPVLGHAEAGILLMGQLFGYLV